MKKTAGNNGRFEYAGIDRVMHEKARLGLMTSLFMQPKGHSFNELKKLCNLTDGNLSRHLKILSEAGLVDIEKTYKDNKPHTVCRLTGNGRQKFIAYMSELEKVIKDAGRVASADGAAENKLKFKPA